jgi:hypothetical protein
MERPAPAGPTVHGRPATGPASRPVPASAPASSHRSADTVGAASGLRRHGDNQECCPKHTGWPHRNPDLSSACNQAVGLVARRYLLGMSRAATTVLDNTRAGWVGRCRSMAWSRTRPTRWPDRPERCQRWNTCSSIRITIGDPATLEQLRCARNRKFCPPSCQSRELCRRSGGTHGRLQLPGRAPTHPPDRRSP